jgi:hypothetical protein
VVGRKYDIRNHKNIFMVSLSILLLISMYSNSKLNKKYRNANNELSKIDEKIDQATASVYHQKGNEIKKLELDIAICKDQSAKWQDTFAICNDELNEWKDDCEMLLDMRNELKLENQQLQEKMQRIYAKEPDLNPKREKTFSASVILAPSTPRDARLSKIHQKLRETKK